HAPGLSVFASPKGVMLGKASSVRSVTTGSVDITGFVNIAGGEPYAASPGQQFLVTVGGESPHTALVVESCGYVADANPNSTGILVEAPQGDGNWRALARINSRRTPDCLAIETEGNDQLRLTTLGECSIQSLRQLRVVDSLTPKALDLVHATHSRLGDVSAEVSSIGGKATTLVGGETLELGFEPTAAPQGKMRDLFLTVRGACYERPSSREAHLLSASTSERFEFALGPARPNPTSGSVSFSFTL